MGVALREVIVMQLVLYHDKQVQLLDRTAIPGAVVADDQVVLGTHEGAFARADGGWTRIEPAVYEKIVDRSEVRFLEN